MARLTPCVCLAGILCLISLPTLRGFQMQYFRTVPSRLLAGRVPVTRKVNVLVSPERRLSLSSPFQLRASPQNDLDSKSPSAVAEPAAAAVLGRSDVISSMLSTLQQLPNFLLDDPSTEEEQRELVPWAQAVVAG